MKLSMKPGSQRSAFRGSGWGMPCPNRVNAELWRGHDPNAHQYGSGGFARGRNRGSAVLVVIILTVIMCALIVANTRVLDHLDRELKQIDREQKKRLSPPPQAQTSGPAQTGKSGSRP
jgi:hypothetical protein